MEVGVTMATMTMMVMVITVMIMVAVFSVVDDDDAVVVYLMSSCKYCNHSIPFQLFIFIERH